jgi:hypothetical protein
MTTVIVTYAAPGGGGPCATHIVSGRFKEEDGTLEIIRSDCGHVRVFADNKRLIQEHCQKITRNRERWVFMADNNLGNEAAHLYAATKGMGVEPVWETEKKPGVVITHGKMLDAFHVMAKMMRNGTLKMESLGAPLFEDDGRVQAVAMLAWGCKNLLAKK